MDCIYLAQKYSKPLAWDCGPRRIHPTTITLNDNAAVRDQVIYLRGVDDKGGGDSFVMRVKMILGSGWMMRATKRRVKVTEQRYRWKFNDEFWEMGRESDAR